MKNKSEQNFIVNIAKVCIVLFLIFIQIFVINMFYVGTRDIANYYSAIFEIIKIIAVLHILCRSDNPSYKIAWILFILFLPVPGIIVYVLWGRTKMPKKIEKKIKKMYGKTQEVLVTNTDLVNGVKNIDKLRYNQINYLTNITGYPLYNCEGVQYINSGAEYFDKMIEDIENAKKYIFIEYFIISESIIWNRLFDILSRKAKEGIEIYIMTDEIGSILRYPKHFKKKLKELGIHLTIFNPITPILTSYINYRDHRKITVIDGNIAYCGGINIGDEYTNKKRVYGHWKDTGIRMIGESVTSYVIMFIRMWNLYQDEQLEHNKFVYKSENNNSNGYIVPYCDGPNNKENPAENIYMQVINTAKDYVYITTPYLILDNEMVTALTNAAKSGVDVRIITPYIADKWFVHIVTKSFYPVLVNAGVKIYEYEPGFIHAKSFVSDNEVAIVGTINLDFRSLYLHYECASYMYKTGIEDIIREDFIEIQEISKQINIEDIQKQNMFKKMISAIIKVFSPMM